MKRLSNMIKERIHFSVVLCCRLTAAEWYVYLLPAVCLSYDGGKWYKNHVIDFEICWLFWRFMLTIITKKHDFLDV